MLNDKLFKAISLGGVLGALISLPTATGAQVPGGTLDPTTIPKYVTPLVIPPPMPLTAVLLEPDPDNGDADTEVDYYEIAVRQFTQQVLPAGFPATTLWGYGSVQYPGTAAEGGSFNNPSFTVEAVKSSPAD